MQQDLLQRAAERIEAAEPLLEEGRSTIQFLREAGEPTEAAEAELQKVIQRVARWRVALANQGVVVGGG